MLTKAYLEWNKAIYEAIYSRKMAGQRVYLDLDDDVMAEISKSPHLTMGNSVDDLIYSVKQCINFEGAADFVFGSFTHETEIWANKVHGDKSTEIVPPMVAFLAVTVLAAEHMGEGERSSAAYYPHFFRLLGIPESMEAKFEKGYRKTVELLWRGLNWWLEGIGQLRGASTAYAITDRYVGLPISQALVKNADRTRLKRMFWYYRLDPGTEISPGEMERLITRWITRDPKNIGASLHKLWVDETARNRISEIASLELQIWDGTADVDPESRNGDRILGDAAFRPLGANRLFFATKVNNFLGQRRLSNFLLVSSPTLVNEDEVTFSYAGENLRFVKRNSNSHCLKIDDLFDVGDMLGARVALSTAEGDKEYARQPRKLIVMAFDETLQMFKEVEKANFGQPLMVLASRRDSYDVSVFAYLTGHARPGFKAIDRDSTEGLPKGWSAIENVQLVEATYDDKLRKDFYALALEPLSTLVLSSGVKLPSFRSQSRWLKGHLPQVQATASRRVKSELKIIKLGIGLASIDQVVEIIRSDIGLVTLDLNSLNLADGDFMLALFENGDVTSTLRFGVGSSTSPDPAAKYNLPAIVRSPDYSGIDYLLTSAEQKHEACPDDNIVGLKSAYRSSWNRPDIVDFSPTRRWEDDDESLKNRTWFHVDVLSPDSCSYTGAHILDLENDPKLKMVEGHCLKCGARNLYNNDRRVAERRKTLKDLYDEASNLTTASAAIDVSEIKEFSWEPVFEVLNYSLGGNYTNLANCIESFNFGSISTSEILQLLEQAGVIEVSRNQIGRESQWRIIEPQAYTNDLGDEFILGGNSKFKDLEVKAELLANGFVYKATSILGSKLGTPIQLESFLESLEPLSKYRIQAKRVAMPEFQEIARFNLDAGGWEASDTPTAGALRLRTLFGNQYFYADSESLKQGTALACSAPLAKYLQANALGISLMKYSEERRTVYVPLGARVPGIYARVLLLSSGTPPVVAKMGNAASPTMVHKYVNIAPQVASKLATLLSA